MALGTQLQQLVSDLRAEAGQSQKVSVGTDAEDRLKRILRRTQETLYDDYDWPHLTIFASKPLVAGQRYYDMPTTMPFMNVIDVAVIDGTGQPIPVTRGIGFEEYAAYDSDNDQRSNPVQAWDLRRTGVSATQIEVWPIPASAQTLWFKGLRTLPALTSNTDTCVVDDVLIVLFAAAELLARSDSKDAELKLKLAQTRYTRLKGKTQGASSIVALGQGSQSRRGPGRSVIRISG